MTDDEIRALVARLEKKADDRTYAMMVFLALIPAVWLLIFGVLFLLYQRHVAAAGLG